MDSYNSKYPLEYYEVGTPYMFYNTAISKIGKAASKDQVKKFAYALKETSEQQGGVFGIAGRYVGVVVDKEAHTEPSVWSAITVMFLCSVEVENPETKEIKKEKVYIKEKYITNYRGVFFDDKENIAPAGTMNLAGKINLDFSDQLSGEKGGGITVDKGGKKPKDGGITIDKDGKIVDGGITVDK